MVEKPKQAREPDIENLLSADGKKNALRIVKQHPAIKEQFKAKFYSSREKIFADDINLMEHGEFLEAAELAANENALF